MKIVIKNCLECIHHSIERDPDPGDWFCDNDEKTVCKKANKIVTSGNRPYETEKASQIPSWCPLKKTKKKEVK